MNAKKAILLFATLLGIVALSFFLTPSDKKLTDRFILYGKVSDMTKSNNHSFGIIGFDVDSIVNGRIDTIRTEVGTPYKIDNSYAEVYAAIPIGAELASRIKVDVLEKTVFLMQGDSILFKSDIYIQTDKQNLEFIRKNSRIVDNKIK
jgi:hypothetical protein